MNFGEEDSELGIELNELTGWEDCDCNTYLEPLDRVRLNAAKQSGANIQARSPGQKLNQSKSSDRTQFSQHYPPFKSLSTSLSLDMLKSIALQESARSHHSIESTLIDMRDASPGSMSKSMVSLPPANTDTEPGTNKRSRDAGSPLDRPFVVYKYSSSKDNGKVREHRHTQLHLVTATGGDPPLSQSHHQDRLPLLIECRNDAAVTDSKRTWPQGCVSESSVPVTQQTSGVQLKRTTKRIACSPTRQTFTRTLDQNYATRPRIQKQLCKNDKPVGRLNVLQGSRMTQRRFSDVSKDRPELNYEDKLPSAPRRRSLCRDTQEKNEMCTSFDRSRGVYGGTTTTSALTNTLAQFTAAPRELL